MVSVGGTLVVCGRKLSAVMALPDRLMTADQLIVLPDDGQRHELVAGFVVSEPPASFRHGDVSAEIFRRLIEFVRGEGLGRVLRIWR